MTCPCGSPAPTTVYLDLAGADVAALERAGLADRKLLLLWCCRSCARELTRDPAAGRQRVLGRMTERRKR